MRPVHSYYFVFTCPGAANVPLMAPGETPCKAKATAFELLERLLKVDETLPKNGWRVAVQEDQGIVE